MATQVQPPLIETEITMLFMSTLQEPYYDRLIHVATGSFTNMFKVKNLVDHAIKNGRIDIGENSSKPKTGIFQRRKQAKPKPYISRTNPINPGDTPRTKTTQIISHITQLQVIKL